MPAEVPRSSSLESVLIVEPTLGLDVSHPSVNAKPGGTPYREDFIIRDGGLDPRPMLSLDINNPQPVDIVLGGAEIVAVGGIRYPFISGTTGAAAYIGGSWSRLSFGPAFGVNTPPAGSIANYADTTQIYDAAIDENLAVWAQGTPQSLYCWTSGATTFSSLTGAPQAQYVTAFNNYLVAFNLAGGFVQRVQWNDRGSNSSWTGGLSGFADLLDMRGAGTRVMAQENRLVLFSEYEVWEGVPAAFPFIFNFDPIDRSVGCPYPWTAANTPAGIIFLSNDYNVYLISKWGGPARSVGDSVQKFIRENITQPQRAWAVYDRTFNQYQLYFPAKAGTGHPQQALFLNVVKVQYSPIIVQVGEGAWSLQTFDKTGGQLALTRGFEAQTSSNGTSWQALKNASVTWGSLTNSWADFAGQTNALRAIHVGSSHGTMYYLNSGATSDNGLPVRSIWRSHAMFGFEPNRQKTMNRMRIDYLSEGQSILTAEASASQGASFDQPIQVTLPANSVLSEAVFHFYTAARYPMFQVSSEGERYKLYRFWLSVRAGGR